MKKKQKILLLVSVLAVLMSAGGYVTYSYLSTVTKTANNTFQSDKKIGITLTEPEWDDHGKTEALSYVPGQIIDKDPAVILDDDSVSSYVALKVQTLSAAPFWNNASHCAPSIGGRLSSMPC